MAPRNHSRPSTVDRPLPWRVLRFIDEYMVDLNGKQAAIRAGYAVRSAEMTASRLIRNDKVREEVERRQVARAEALKVHAEDVVRELAYIGFANMFDFLKISAEGDPYFDFSTLTRDQASAIGELTIEEFVDGRGQSARAVRRIRFRLADKRAALVDIGKHLGMFRERIEHSGPSGAPIDLIHSMRPPVRDYAEIRRRICESNARKRSSEEKLQPQDDSR